jgi:cobalt/nickel transport system permease protein
MHHLVIERWSRGNSILHRWDARLKILACLLVLIIIATTPNGAYPSFAGFFLLLAVAALAGNIPLGPCLLRAAIVLPLSIVAVFTAGFAHAVSIPVKSYLSALTALILIGTTPLAVLLRGLGSLHAPKFVLLVIQFLYRYLFVLADQATTMRQAAQCRGGHGKRRRSLFNAAAAALAVLFGRSYSRAERIQQAMAARGFSGRLALLSSHELRWSDGALFVLASAVLVAIRLV